MSLGVSSWPSSEVVRSSLFFVMVVCRPSQRIYVANHPSGQLLPACLSCRGNLHRMKTKIGDIEVGYDRAGEGDPVLLVMGLATPRIGWFHQFQFLSQSYDVTSFDNRGVGETLCPGPWTMADM